MTIKATQENCLANLFLDIADEWHPTKNGVLTPQKVTAKSGKKVWWQCACGHEWEATISNRTQNGSSCPFCKGKKAIVGVNDLQTTNPKLALEWHPTRNGALVPQNMKGSSKKKIWWICEKGHEWQATLDSRSKGHGCPYCSGRYAETGVNDLETLRPDVAQCWHPTKNRYIKPDKVTVASGVKYWWLGKCGHEWQARVAHMCNKKSLDKCPVCNSQYRTSFPEQAVFYYAKKLFPDSISRYGAHKKELDIYIPSLHVGIEYDGLLYHSAENIQREIDKDKYFKELNIQVFHLKEREQFPTIMSDFSVWYRPWDKYKRLNDAIRLLFNSIADYCKLTLSELDIDIERDNAEILSGFLKKKREDGFAAKHPDLLKEWHPIKNGSLDPEFITEKSNQKFWWKCICGHEWHVAVNDRVSKRTGCPLCYKAKKNK